MPKQRAEKPVLVLTTIISMTKATKKADLKAKKEFELWQVTYIYYPTQIVKFSIEALINSDRKINEIQTSFISKLGLRSCKTHGIIIALFQVDNKDKKSHFVKKRFLFADISMYDTFRMLFFTLSNINIKFNNRELRWRLYNKL